MYYYCYNHCSLTIPTVDVKQVGCVFFSLQHPTIVYNIFLNWCRANCRIERRRKKSQGEKKRLVSPPSTTSSLVRKSHPNNGLSWALLQDPFRVDLVTFIIQRPIYDEASRSFFTPSYSQQCGTFDTKENFVKKNIV